MKIRFFCTEKIPHKNNLLKFSTKICRNLRVLKNQGEICIIFVSDKKIRVLNRSFLKKNSSTDVIAFRYESRKYKIQDVGRKARGNNPFGDIFVSIDAAKTQSKIGNYPMEREIALLIMHGLLHLGGHRDYTVDQRKKMFALQKKMFRKVNLSLAPSDFQ